MCEEKENSRLKRIVADEAQKRVAVSIYMCIVARAPLGSTVSIRRSDSDSYIGSLDEYESRQSIDAVLLRRIDTKG